VLAGDALSSVGSGLTLPFLVIYLHQVRQVGLAAAMLAVSALAVSGLVGNPLAGSLADRSGARNTLVVGLFIAALGAIAMTLVRSAPQGIAAAGLVGLGAAVIWPAQDALLASLVEPAERSRAFALRYATMNAGLGVGALVAATIVDVGSPVSFDAIYLLDAATFLLFVPILLLGIRSRPGQSADSQDSAAQVGGGFRLVVRDRRFMRVWLLSAFLVTIGYAQCDAAFPAFATRAGGISVRQLAIANAANTITIVLGQLLVLRLVEGRSRTRMLVASCGFFAATWTLTLAAGARGEGTAAVAIFALAMVAFAIGEMLVAPTLPAIVNDLAPDALRGRYNGVYVLAWTTGYAVGPAIAGLAITSGSATALFAGLIGACGLAAAAAARLAPSLPAAPVVHGEHVGTASQVTVGVGAIEGAHS
jgi:MFS family permease